MRALLLLSAVALIPCGAWAQGRPVAISEKPDQISVTVYPQVRGMHLFMVTETRTVDAPAGPVRIQFRDVAERIVPQTVSLSGLPQSVGEQNFDYYLLTQGSLIKASEGRNISLVRTLADTGRQTEQRGRVVSGAQGAVLEIDGRVEGFQCSGAPEKLVFDDLPEGFVAKPILSVDTVLPAPQRLTLSLSYLALGVTWQANYLARLAPDGKTLSLASWITIANRTGNSFPEAPLQVMAGRLEQRPDETRPPVIPIDGFDPHCWPVNSGRFAPASVIRRQLFREVDAFANATERARQQVEVDAMRGYAATEVRAVVSVGTYLRSGAEDTALNIEATSRDDLLKSGSPSMEQLIRRLTESGLNDAGDNRGQNAFGVGIRTINLRNLGAGRTLTLFDGVRLADDPQTNGGPTFTRDPNVQGGGAQNVNNIPMEVLASVEILKDGGAAVYGGDAAGGAVSFTPRRDLNGFEVGASFTAPAPVLAAVIAGPAAAAGRAIFDSLGPGVQPLPDPEEPYEVQAARVQAEVAGRKFADYTLYALPEPTSLAAYQTKQVLMFEREAVPVSRIYRFDAQKLYGNRAEAYGAGPQVATTVLKLRNEARSGLGLSLPAGRITVMDQNPGGPTVVAGVVQIADTAAGLPLELVTGAEANVQLATRTKPNTRSGWRQGEDVEMTVTNAFDHEVTVEIRDPVSRQGEKVLRESHRHSEKGGLRVWTLTLAAHSSGIVRYTQVWRD